MRAFLFGVGCAIIGAASGFAGGYVYNQNHDERPASVIAPASTPYCYDPHPGPHLYGDPEEQVCVR